ncbi:FxSxx-COOH system tetratricopeptide repeat protein [Sphaerisporangium sp. B11E5]|uniref:FxSxx-COOH system tetratricopeptide repeat protein n=1 Tax=Sphaerisporangium sp. B11E5 TaxID=3153563 RepID=UPI00325DD49C
MPSDQEEELQRFIDDLAALRVEAGKPSYRDLERHGRGRLMRSTVSEVLGGKRKLPPSWPFVEAFVMACRACAPAAGGAELDDEELIGYWRERWGALQAALHARGEAAGRGEADATPRILGGALPVKGMFTGRERHLDRLRRELETPGRRPVCLVGPGGVGKTQLAAEYVGLFASSYEIVWWVRAEEASLARSGLAALGRRLQLDIEDQEIIPGTLEALRVLGTATPWLLVFDNAEQPETLQDFLPHGEGRVLVTSRHERWGEVASTLEVGVFEREDSVELLQQRVPGITRADAVLVAAEMGDLPLAIVQAAAYLKKTGCPPEDYVQMVRSCTAMVMDDPPVDYPVSLASAWTIALDQLRDTAPDAVELLSRCAFFGPESIPRRLLQEGDLPLPGDSAAVFRNRLRVNGAIGELTSSGLMRLDSGRRTFQVHRLLQSMIRQKLTVSETTRCRHDVHLLIAGSGCGDAQDSANWSKYAELVGHAKASAIAECDEEGVRDFVSGLVRYFSAIGDEESVRDYASTVPESSERPEGDGPGERAGVRPDMSRVVLAPRGRRMVHEMDETDWERLIYQVTTGDCTPIIGAHLHSERTRRMQERSREWARALDFPFADPWNLEAVLDFAVTLSGGAEASAAIIHDLRREYESWNKDEITDPHAFMASVPISVYLTTDHGGQMTRALRRVGREPTTRILPWEQEAVEGSRDVWPTPERPLVCHLQGSIDQPETLILSEKDRIDYTGEVRWGENRVAIAVLAALTRNPLLLVGHNPRSLSYRLLLSFLRSHEPSVTRRTHVMVLSDPAPGGIGASAARYHLARIEQMNLHAAVFWGDGQEFTRELLRRLETRR